MTPACADGSQPVRKHGCGIILCGKGSQARLIGLLLHKWWPSWVDWVLVILCMGTIFYYSSQLHPDVPGIEFSPFRKTLHVSEYVLLFVLWGRALHQTWPGNGMRAVRCAL